MNQDNKDYVLEVDKMINLNNNDDKRWKKINPSIVQINDQYLLLYRLHNKNFLFWESKIGVLKLDSSFNFISDTHIENMPGKSLLASGYEDPRVFIHQDKLYCLCTLVENFISKQYLLHLSQDSNGMQVKDQKKLQITFESMNSHQKNWNAIPISKNEILFSTRIEPHIIVNIDFETGIVKKLFETSNDKLAKLKKGGVKIHGGTSPILYNNKYLAICHLKRGGRYTNIFYEFSPDTFQIERISKEFLLPIPDSVSSSKVQMITGLTRVINNSNDTILITAGLMDETMMGYLISEKKINDMFNN